MARKKKAEEHENHERWLVSYADFITLLFAFFVVMYSISSVNEGKYRVLSSSLITAFSQPAKTVKPIQHGIPLRSPIVQHQSMMDRKEVQRRVGVDYQILPSPKEHSDMQKIIDEVSYNLKELIDQNLVDVFKTDKGVEIEINSKILFTSGSARLDKKAKDILFKVAKILGKKKNQINVEGFTDNIPIKTFMFPSNWELSAARAASVVHLFTKTGVDAARLAAIGYGEHQAKVANDTIEGRQKNRRVAIVVLNRPNKRRNKLDKKKITLGATQIVEPNLMVSPVNPIKMAPMNGNVFDTDNADNKIVDEDVVPLSGSSEKSDRRQTLKSKPTPLSPQSLSKPRSRPRNKPIKLPGPTLLPMKDKLP